MFMTSSYLLRISQNEGILTYNPYFVEVICDSTKPPLVPDNIHPSHLLPGLFRSRAP